jgi:hypothetical protein
MFMKPLPAAAALVLLFAANAGAQSTPTFVSTADPPPNAEPSRPAVPDDPTGGAYTSPTLLFTPAAAVPVWTVRAIASLDMQGPVAADRLATSSGSLGFMPGLGGEVGLPLGFTVAAGTNWVGGDVSPTPISGGLSPYVQARKQLYGDPSGKGFLLGTSLTYKFVGFQGDPGEMELAVSAQYRRPRYELGLQAVGGKDFATTSSDLEAKGYALYRVIPQLGVGAAGQARYGVVSQPGQSTYDVVSGGMTSVTISRWQLGALGGVTTIGLNQGQVGGLGEVFGSARF